MKETTYRVIISLFPEKGGGRVGFIVESYTPNAVFGFDLKKLPNIWNGKYYSFKASDTESIMNVGVKLKLLNKDKIYPGGVALAELKISKDARNYIGDKLLRIGDDFLIREGSRVVGIGQFVT